MIKSASQWPVSSRFATASGRSWIEALFLIEARVRLARKGGVFCVGGSDNAIAPLPSAWRGRGRRISFQCTHSAGLARLLPSAIRQSAPATNLRPDDRGRSDQAPLGKSIAPQFAANCRFGPAKRPGYLSDRVISGRQYGNLRSFENPRQQTLAARLIRVLIDLRRESMTATGDSAHPPYYRAARDKTVCKCDSPITGGTVRTNNMWRGA